MKTLVFFCLLIGSLLSVPAGAGYGPKSLRKKLEAGCLKSGGEWGTWTKFDGANDHPTCRHRAADAGLACTESKNCSTGRCEYLPEKKAGACTAFPGSEGCHTWMEKGKVEGTLCVD